MMERVHEAVQVQVQEEEQHAADRNGQSTSSRCGILRVERHRVQPCPAISVAIRICGEMRRLTTGIAKLQDKPSIVTKFPFD